MSAAPTLGTAVGYRPRLAAVLGYVVEGRAAGLGDLGATRVGSPWDAWWLCYRTAVPAPDLGVGALQATNGCDLCDRDANALASASSPLFPLGRSCDCLYRWAVTMRQPALDVDWPPLRTQVAMVKPGGDAAAVADALRDSHVVVHSIERRLVVADIRRLYPDAYGADYVARQDAYLLSGPVLVLVLVAIRWAATQPRQLKARIRGLLGAAGPLHNHLHMPDNPGEALCDVHHLAGGDVLRDLYDRYDRDTVLARMACYRDLLGLR